MRTISVGYEFGVGTKKKKGEGNIQEKDLEKLKWRKAIIEVKKKQDYFEKEFGQFGLNSMINGQPLRP